MRLFVALRLFNEWHAKVGVESFEEPNVSRGRVNDVQVDRLYPALKNIIGYLTSTGRLASVRQGEVLRTENGQQVVSRQANCRLYWCDIESDYPIEFWESKDEVEVVLPKEDFDRFALSIRCKSGTAYVEACEAYARRLRINSAETIRYEPPRTPNVQAA